MGRLKERLSARRMSSGGQKKCSQDSENYEGSRLRARDLILISLGTAGLLTILSYAFFESAVPVIIGSIPVFLLARRTYAASQKEKRKYGLKKAFMNAITMLGGYLKSGQSAESAVSSSAADLRTLYGEQSDIVRAWTRIENGLHLNRPIEDLFAEFGERSKIREIEDFSEIFRMTKRSGGNISRAMSESAELLAGQFEVDEKIKTMVSARKFEQHIMDVIPVAIILYVKIGSPGLLDPLYTTGPGRAVMCACLFVYVFSAVWAEKMTEIRM